MGRGDGQGKAVGNLLHGSRRQPAKPSASWPLLSKRASDASDKYSYLALDRDHLHLTHGDFGEGILIREGEILGDFNSKRISARIRTGNTGIWLAFDEGKLHALLDAGDQPVTIAGDVGTGELTLSRFGDEWAASLWKNNEKGERSEMQCGLTTTRATRRPLLVVSMGSVRTVRCARFSGSISQAG